MLIQNAWEHPRVVEARKSFGFRDWVSFKKQNDKQGDKQHGGRKRTALGAQVKFDASVDTLDHKNKDYFLTEDGWVERNKKPRTRCATVVPDDAVAF